MDAIGPNLPGCPIEDEERIALMVEMDPDSLLYQYLTWLETEIRETRDLNEQLNRRIASLRRHINRREP